MSLTLQVRDLGNGHGAKVKVSGTPTPITLYRATAAVDSVGSYASVLTPMVPDTEYTVAGTGYYYWKATASGPTQSNEVYQPASEYDLDASDPWSRCITMIKDRIDALDDLDWTWLKGGVVVYFTPTIDEKDSPLNITSPCILITIAGEVETIEDKTNQQDDITYPVVVSVVEKKAEKQEEKRGRILWHRWRIHRALHGTNWDRRVPECWQVRVRPAQVLHTRWLEESAVRWSLLTAQCQCREVRRAPETWTRS